MSNIGKTVHYFYGNSWRFVDGVRQPNCIAAIITRRPSISSNTESEPLSDLVVFDSGVRYVLAPHHTDFRTREYHDYDSGSWHNIDECEEI